MQVKRVIRYLLEPLLERLPEPLSALEPPAETLLEPPFQHLFGTLSADPSSARTPSSDLPASPPRGLFCLKP